MTQEPTLRPVTAPKPPAQAGDGTGTPAPPKPRPAPPQPPVSRPILKPAAPAYRRRRHTLILLSFLVAVLLPSAVTGFYLYAIAADQYASKVGFSVRREDSNSALELLGGLTNISNSSSSDTDILYEFIQSQKLVADIDKDLDLRAIWSRSAASLGDGDLNPGAIWARATNDVDGDLTEILTRPAIDIVFAIDDEASIEELVHYWNRMVRISYGAGSGLIEVEVLAFTAEDATAISRTLFDKSSQMINELSDIARQDAISYAKEELEEAIERLKDARAVVTRFRNVHQIVNPEIDIQTQAGLIGNLQTQQAQTLIDIDLLRAGNISATDPRLVQATRRLQVIENRIAAERQKLGMGGQDSGGTAFADLLGDYERLVVDREFAENSYVTALATHDAALAEARRKTRYLAAYMQPTKAQTPEYPKRLTILGLVVLFLFLIWSVAVLIATSVRDRR